MEEYTELEKQIIEEARSWIGTKWIHGQALKGVGTDCIQMIISIAKTFGWIPQNYTVAPYNQDYALHNETSQIKAGIVEFCYEVTDGKYKVGDIMLFAFGKCASHAGIYVGDNRIVHAPIKYGVLEDNIKNVGKPLESVWRRFHV